LPPKGIKWANIDATIALQNPKIKNMIPQMQQVLSLVMGIDTDCLSIKATTTERLGFEGEEKGVSAYATVLICK
jgi:2-C-methyl-D-erythritol 2,4-cyclodiphosphate synthase (EC 4.6.1.12)